jgi:nucleoside-diphosphate-sugar epimerase
MILVTGGSGFVGRHLVQALVANSCRVVVPLRSSTNLNPINDSLISIQNIPSIDGNTNWTSALEGVDTVIHCAAVAHGKQGDAWAVNVEGTKAIARQAAQSGVRRFVFLSSVGVHGMTSFAPIGEASALVPATDYGIQKLRAEEILREISSETGLDVVIIRPPLVYGAGAPGNFGLLFRAVRLGIPLPFSGIQNRRSFVSVWNLAHFITLCALSNNACNKTFLVSDGETITTTLFLRLLGETLERPARLFRVPRFLMEGAARLLNKPGLAEQIFGNLEIDDGYARAELNWNPRYSVEESLFRSFNTGEG